MSKGVDHNVIICNHPRPAVVEWIAGMLDGYATYVCGISTTGIVECRARHSDFLVRSAPSTLCLPHPMCRNRPEHLQMLFLSEGWLETEDAAHGAGMAAYLGPSFTSEHVYKAIKALLAGGSFYHPRNEKGCAIGPLTKRQVEVLALVGCGLTDQGIKARIKIHERTVRVHLEALFKKLRVERRGNLIMQAAKGGLCEGVWWTAPGHLMPPANIDVWHMP
jgi:DNA-binding CsgD family transcriptional regulator